MVDGLVAAAIARYDRLNASSPAAVLVQHAGFTRTAADNLRKLGRKLDTDLPAPRERLTGGRIGTAQARTIAALDDVLAAADERTAGGSPGCWPRPLTEPCWIGWWRGL